jgi:RHS repeat-associated protein
MKATVWILTVLFVVTPIAPVFAQEAKTPIVSEPAEKASQGTRRNAPEPKKDTPAEAAPESVKPSEDPTSVAEQEKPKQEKPTEVEPRPMAATGPQAAGVNFEIPTQAKASVDQSTGALVYDYPITLPEGRAGMTPELSLRYNSRNISRADSIVGLGSELSIPYIQRESVKGTNTLYTNAFFSSSLSGNLIATTDTSFSQFTTYRPETDNGDYKKYTYNSHNTWTMTGKDGRTYTFGGQSASRQDDPTDPTKVYKWMVSKITDVNGNEIQYSYTKNSGQIYPSQILYTHHTFSPAVHIVNFTYTTPTDYGSTVYNSAFAVTTSKLLSTIVVTTTVGTNTTTDTYTFSYLDAQFLKQKTLTSIRKSTNFAVSESYDPFNETTSFSYSTKTPGWEAGTHSLGTNYTTFDNDVIQDTYIADFDLNGYPDVLISSRVGNTYHNHLMMNNGTTFIDSLSSWGLPANVDYSYYYAIVDVNGDRLPDLHPRYNNQNPTLPLYLNTGSGFISDTSGTWLMDNYVSQVARCAANVGDATSYYTNTFLYDINHDGKNDIVYFGGTNFKVYLNNGSGWSVSSAYTFILKPGSTYDFTKNCNQSSLLDNFQTLLDINGDGLEDYIHILYGTYLNTGSGFAYNAAYSFETTYTDRTGYADINGDGLVDLVVLKNIDNTKCTQVNINNGAGFTIVNPTSTTTCTNSLIWDPINLQYANNNSWTWGTLMDVTADGFPDIIGANGVTDIGKVRSINDSKSEWVLNPANEDQWMQFIAPNRGVFFDVNADGVLDFITPEQGWSGGTMMTNKVGIGKTSIPNRLTQITNMFGVQTVIEYGTSPTNYNDKNISPMPVVKKVTVQNIGFGQPDMVTQYAYTNGSYAIDVATGQRRFAGFHKVTATESGANLTPLRITETYFHQANGSDSATNEPTDIGLALIGRPYYSVVKHPSNTPKKETWNKYGQHTLQTEPTIGRLSEFVYPTETVTKTTEGGTTAGTADVHTFDTTLGEQIELRNMGFVTVGTDGTYTDIADDTKYQFTEYATNSGDTIVKPKRVDLRTTSANGDTISRTDLYYDNQTHGTIGTLGNLTKELKWVSGNGSMVADTTYTHDTYGNVLTITNPRGAVTTYVYDTINSQIASETNQLNHTTNYEYITGKLSKVTDPNGAITRYGYSTQGRLFRTATPSTLGDREIKQWIGNMNPLYIETYRQLATTNFDHESDLRDRLGRSVQYTRSKKNHETNEISGHYQQWTKNYDALGREIIKSAINGTPITNFQNTVTAPPSNLIITTTYDVFDRPISIVNALGTTTLSYTGTETAITDANSKQKKVKTDAYGNIVQVKELNGASTYTTAYTYNIQNLLTKVTDALGNIRNFTYNNAGWLTNSEDLHASADSSFGSYSFTYDLNGNRLVETQPNGVTVTRVHDMLDRPTSIDSSSSAATDYTLIYDSCVNGKGRLCTVSGTLPDNITLSKTYAYGISGVPTSVSITTLGSTYTTRYLYNYSDQIAKITYPNNTIIRYTFGDWAKPDKVYVTLPGGSETTFATATYNHNEQPLVTTITGGPTITNTYDGTKLYRLTRKQATSAGGSTTVSFYPTAGDGYIYHDNANWDTVHDAATGTSASYTGTNFYVGTSMATATSYRIRRTFIPFDTSSLPDGATITDAKLKIYPTSKANNDNDGDDWLTVVQATQPSLTSLTTADFDLAGSINTPTEGIDTTERKDITNIATGAYLTFNLNAIGRSWINTTGPTKLGIREGHDVIDSPFTGTSGQNNHIIVNSSEATGTTTDPVLEVTYNTSSTYQDSNYTYDNVNNITQITEPGLSKTYTYDDLYRLTRAVYTPMPGSPTTYTYAYNAIGNITSANGISYTYSSTGKTNPHAVTGIGSNNYTYDDNGNIATSPYQVYTFNWQNQPTRITIGGSTTIGSYYDEKGQRFIYQTQGSNEVRVDDTYLVRSGTPEISLKLGDVPIGTISSGMIHSSIADHLGTPVKQINSSGTVVEAVTYGPFGEVLSQTGTLNTKHGYTGHEYDTDTGLNYMNARYYDPTIGRFLSQDPSHVQLGSQYFEDLIGIKRDQILRDPQQLNSYGYVRNNPINVIDSTGKYGQISSSGTAMGWSGEIGFRFDSSGLNFFAAGGAGVGLKGSPLSLSYTPGELSHTTESTVSIGGSAAHIVGGGLAISGQYQPDTYSIKDPSIEKSFIIGYGAEIYARKEISIPLLGRKPAPAPDSILTRKLYWSTRESLNKNKETETPIPNNTEKKKDNTSNSRSTRNARNRRSN